jgi:hypothetical protein
VWEEREGLGRWGRDGERGGEWKARDGGKDGGVGPGTLIDGTMTARPGPAHAVATWKAPSGE